MTGVRARRSPLVALLINRIPQGVVTLLLVSIIVYFATQLLPGDAAHSILGPQATPEQVAAISAQLHLNESPVVGYWHWLSGMLSGRPGESLTLNGASVWSLVGPRMENSAVLLVVSGTIGSVLGVALGCIAALRRDRLFDHIFGIFCMIGAAVPAFVVAVAVVLLFATGVFHLLPGVSNIPPGSHAWSSPELLVLPTVTLVVVVVPYIARMMRGAAIEALESDYAEYAVLRGVSTSRLLWKHALPNALAPTIQAIALSVLYLAGGIVVVEVVFAYPGLGWGLVDAVDGRDVPVIQFTVLVLAAFYVVVNVLSDIFTLMVTPKMRTATS